MCLFKAKDKSFHLGQLAIYLVVCVLRVEVVCLSTQTYDSIKAT